MDSFNNESITVFPVINTLSDIPSFLRFSADFIVGAKENVPLKPQRQMIDFICYQYDSGENEFIMVGDTNVDILAAKNAGISSVIVDGGYTNKDCKSLGADFYLNNISELRSVLNL